MASKHASPSPITPDMLDGMSVAELTAFIRDAEAKRDAKMADAKRDLIEEMRSRAEQLGLSLEQLLPQGREGQDAQASAKSRETRTPSADSHRLPSGAMRKARGKPSRAYTEELEQLKAQGHSESDFLIEKS